MVPLSYGEVYGGECHVMCVASMWGLVADAVHSVFLFIGVASMLTRACLR
jgi:hypothetical protein